MKNNKIYALKNELRAALILSFQNKLIDDYIREYNHRHASLPSQDQINFYVEKVLVDSGVLIHEVDTALEDFFHCKDKLYYLSLFKDSTILMMHLYLYIGFLLTYLFYVKKLNFPAEYMHWVCNPVQIVNSVVLFIMGISVFSKKISSEN